MSTTRSTNPWVAVYGVSGGALGFLGVAAGAFGAHALRSTLGPAMMQVYETGARYQLVHALALVLTAVSLERQDSRALAAAGAMFVSGCVLFSGSLYALALTESPAWGLVTPFGGACFLVGWLCLAAGFTGRRSVSA